MEHSVAYTLADRLANPSRHDNDESEYNEEEEEHPGEEAAAEEGGFEESHGDERPTADQTKNNKNKVEIPSSKALGIMNEYLMAPVVARAPQKRNEVLYAEFLDMGRRAGNMYVYCRHCLNAYHDDMARYKQAVQDHKESTPSKEKEETRPCCWRKNRPIPFFVANDPKIVATIYNTVPIINVTELLMEWRKVEFRENLVLSCLRRGSSNPQMTMNRTRRSILQVLTRIANANHKWKCPNP